MTQTADGSELYSSQAAAGASAPSRFAVPWAETLRGCLPVESVQELHAVLRQAVLDGTLVPGQTLSQVELAQVLGVSRTPLREALRLLEAEGLVEAERHRRTRVTDVDPAFVDALYARRILLEALGTRLSLPLVTADDVRELRQRFREMIRGEDSGDIVAWDVAHREFHRVLVRYAGDALRQTIEECTDRCERYRRLYGRTDPSARADSDAQHAALIEAYEKRDEARTVELVARHFARTPSVVAAHFAPGTQPRAVLAAFRLLNVEVVGADGGRWARSHHGA